MGSANADSAFLLILYENKETSSHISEITIHTPSRYLDGMQFFNVSIHHLPPNGFFLLVFFLFVCVSYFCVLFPCPPYTSLAPFPNMRHFQKILCKFISIIGGVLANFQCLVVVLQLVQAKCHLMRKCLISWGWQSNKIQVCFGFLHKTNHATQGMNQWVKSDWKRQRKYGSRSREEEQREKWWITTTTPKSLLGATSTTLPCLLGCFIILYVWPKHTMTLFTAIDGLKKMQEPKDKAIHKVECWWDSNPLHDTMLDRIRVRV